MPDTSPDELCGLRRFKLIACEIAFRELCLLAANSRNIIDPVFLRKGLHDVETADMLAELQQEIDAVDDSRYETVLLAYGRCNDGVAGLCARTIPLVIPRAHDCITFFLGSKERYQEYFDGNPGTYFRTSGWIERAFASEEAGVMRKLGLDRTREDYVAEYGEENADYIMQIIGSWEENYTRIAFIDTGVARQLDYAERCRGEADDKDWEYEEVAGELELLRGLLDGDWDDKRFLVVPPGHTIRVRNDAYILDAEKTE